MSKEVIIQNQSSEDINFLFSISHFLQFSTVGNHKCDIDANGMFNIYYSVVKANVFVSVKYSVTMWLSFEYAIEWEMAQVCQSFNIYWGIDLLIGIDQTPTARINYLTLTIPPFDLLMKRAF